MANPNKTPEIVDVLANNKEKLLKYLGDFHTEKGAQRSVLRLAGRSHCFGSQQRLLFSGLALRMHSTPAIHSFLRTITHLAACRV